MTTSFDEILGGDLLRAMFQPIVATADVTIVGYEGLIRGPAGSALETPGALFACARAAGRVRELEHACLRVLWPRFCVLGLPGKLYLNVGAGTLMAGGTGDKLAALLADIGADPCRVVLEITEDQAVTDYRRLSHVAKRLAALGYELAIDDLGAGFASLRLWLELRPACVKLDNAFVRGVDADPLKRSFLDLIQQLAHCAGARLIAEGIETARELEVVLTLGIDHAQGYHIAGPSAQPPRVLTASTRKAM
jgi:EAL domain-containing protein (putative c-di-GMP-specific phosphodiesterase class I)